MLNESAGTPVSKSKVTVTGVVGAVNVRLRLRLTSPATATLSLLET